MSDRIVSKENMKLYGRLFNFKFNQATSFLEGEPQEVRDLVEALARVFGNIGWFDGDMATIIDHALQNIGVDREPSHE